MRWGAETQSPAERMLDRVRSLLTGVKPVLGLRTDEPTGTQPQDVARRCNPGRGGVLAIALVAAASCVVTGLWVLAARPDRIVNATPGSATSIAASPLPGGSLQSPQAQPSPSAGNGAGSAVSAAPSASAGGLVVDVVGKVRRPGVYELRPGSRVADALSAAGGAAPGADLTATNLARRLTDGEQVPIGLAAVGAALAGAGGAAGWGSAGVAGPAGGAGVSTGAAVDLNSATVTQLDALPGVGPVLAQHIVDWRTQHGRFESVDQLNSVSGIGDAKYADLKPLVAVSS